MAVQKRGRSSRIRKMHICTAKINPIHNCLLLLLLLLLLLYLFIRKTVDSPQMATLKKQIEKLKAEVEILKNNFDRYDDYLA